MSVAPPREAVVNGAARHFAFVPFPDICIILSDGSPKPKNIFGAGTFMPRSDFVQPAYRDDSDLGFMDARLASESLGGSKMADPWVSTCSINLRVQEAARGDR